MTAPAKFYLPILLSLVLVACGGGGGGSSAPPPQPSATLTASAGDVRKDGTVTLTWTSSNSTSCSASGGTGFSGSLSTGGTQSVTVTQTSTYSITCSGAGGQTSASATVTAWAAPTATVTSSDAEILADNTTTITWSSQNAKTCKGTAGLAEGISTSGTLTTPSLTATTTYSLECVNPVYPAAAASVQVAVSKTYELLVTARYERPGKGKAGADGIVIPDWDNPIVATIPNVWIELQKATGETVAGAFASNDGAVRFTGLDPAQKYIPTLRSKAKNGSGFELWVVNNTKPISTVATTIRTRYEPYKDAAAEFAADKKKVKQELIVTAGLGWDKASQKLTDTQRVSGPYAIVADAMTQQSFLLPTGARNAINAIDILWSVGNKGGGTSPQADFDKGIVEGFSAFYSSCGATISTDGIRTGCGATDKTPFIWLLDRKLKH